MATAPKTGGDKAAATTKKPGIRVVSRPPTFRRAGREFSSEPTDIPLDELAKGQEKVLREEPELVVVDIEIEVAAPAEEKAEAK